MKGPWRICRNGSEVGTEASRPVAIARAEHLARSSGARHSVNHVSGDYPSLHGPRFATIGKRGGRT